MNDKGCKCQGCDEYYTVDVIVPDKVWENIKPEGKAKGAGLLCGRCIFTRVERVSDFAAYDLTGMR